MFGWKQWSASKQIIPIGKVRSIGKKHWNPVKNKVRNFSKRITKSLSPKDLKGKAKKDSLLL